ncbi:hypothetical protein ABFX02_12G023000 [Erythranthe guttata]
MGFSKYGRNYHFAISALLFLIFSTSSQFTLFTTAQGRRISQITVDNHNSKAVNGEQEDKYLPAAAMILRAQIGSRPPRCERRCSNCGRCEAIQVPTNPQRKRTTSSRNIPAVVDSMAYARGGGDNSNYKPMSWKCKCGNLIFNP